MKNIIFIVIVLFLTTDLLYGQCAMCKAVAETGNDSSEGENIGAGINKGILYLMAVPYILLFLFFRKRIVSFLRGN